MAGIVNNVSLTGFGAPGFDYSAQLADIQRRQQMADALQQQAFQPIETQSVGGMAGKASPWQALAKMFQGYMSGKVAQGAQQEMADLSKQSRADLSDVLTRSQTAMQGAPETPSPSTPVDEAMGNYQPGTPATPSNPALAAQILMSHPMTMQAGMGLMQTNLQNKMRAQMMADIISRYSGAQQPGQPAAPGQSPVFGGAPPMAMALIGSGDPALEKVGQTMLETSKGIAQRPGAPVVNPYTGAVIAQPTPSVPPGVAITLGPNGATAAPVPGANEAMGAAAGAVAGGTEAAKAPYDLVPQVQADGSTLMVPKSLVAGVGTPVGQSPAPAPQAPRVPVPQTRTPVSGASYPGGQLPVNAAGAITAIPANEVQAAQAAGVNVKPDPWASMPRLSQPTGPGQSTFNRVMQEEAAKSAAELSTKYGGLADVANNRIALNNQALDMVNKSDTGTGAATIANVKNFLVSRLGIPEADFANTPSATIALQKDLVNAATQKAKQQFGTRMTQSEVQLWLTKGSPSADMTKAAIQFLLNSDNAQAQYQIQQANDFGKYVSQGGDPQRFEAWYARSFPMTDSLKGANLGTPGIAPQAQGNHPADINLLLQKYGSAR